jgi:predicted DNA-binding transcriptional regulator AlpA
MTTEILLDTKEVARRLNFAPYTIRESRCTGKLAGRPAPAHVKLGRLVRYRASEIDRWARELPEQAQTQ